MNITAKKLLGPSWAHKIGDEFDKKYMVVINNTIARDRKNSIVYPEKDKDIFTVFRDLEFEDVKVVIIGQDPYHDGSYNGMAFANKEPRSVLSPSLRNIFKELEDDIYDGLLLDPDITLKSWQKQGVLLMNTALTVQAGKPGSHSNIGWQKFTGRAIDELGKDSIPRVFIAWGAKAAEFLMMYKSYNKNHLVLGSVHPSPLSAYRGFFGSKPFSKTNKFLKSQNEKEIKW